MLKFNLEDYIRVIPNFPKQGVSFKDISLLLTEIEAYDYFLKEMSKMLPPFDYIIGIESRGFLIASSLAILLKKPMIMVRKKGKLPPPVKRQSYSLEYAEECLEISSRKYQGEKCIIVDDVRATGGTLKASRMLAEKVGLNVVSTATLIDLSFLHRDSQESLIPHHSLYKEE